MTTEKLCKLTEHLKILFALYAASAANEQGSLVDRLVVSDLLGVFDNLVAILCIDADRFA